MCFRDGAARVTTSDRSTVFERVGTSNQQGKGSSDEAIRNKGVKSVCANLGDIIAGGVERFHQMTLSNERLLSLRKGNFFCYELDSESGL